MDAFEVVTKHQLQNLQMLKLGGSLITDKSRPHTARLEILTRLAKEIAIVYRQETELKLIIGHGSGSFGHRPAQRHGTRKGVHTPDQWLGFVEVWQEAASLNRIVIDALLEAGLPVIAFAPSACVTARAGRIESWNLSPIIQALTAGLMPLVHGDVAFDCSLGGTILSTEDLFIYLAKQLHPKRMLLAGSEPGVWMDYPTRKKLAKKITPSTYHLFSQALDGSEETDVTGGMASKVQLCLELVQQIPDLEIHIFTGFEPEAITRGLHGKPTGTLICNK